MKYIFATASREPKERTKKSKEPEAKIRLKKAKFRRFR